MNSKMINCGNCNKCTPQVHTIPQYSQGDKIEECGKWIYDMFVCEDCWIKAQPMKIDLTQFANINDEIMAQSRKKSEEFKVAVLMEKNRKLSEIRSSIVLAGGVEMSDEVLSKMTLEYFLDIVVRNNLVFQIYAPPFKAIQ